ncbi:MAG: metal-sulfur cluster assembly factor [Thermoanaerobaculum sp.]|nr:metal-sulfur cluster assembly factor [Thermoanaerobaculum sp.]MCX7895729.1 metal-sulfur cluster assembly factor [Thermoanaerobaculum sp.]MDW7968420.1 metal-sulfur cluster assembly factor [Thermoanaerobaculum sp.]
MDLTVETVKKALQPVVDPEIGISVVDLGLIRAVEIAPEGVVTVRMTLTSPFCPEGPAIVQEVEHTVRSLPGVKEAAVELVWNPPWDPRTEASDEVKAMLGIWD